MDRLDGGLRPTQTEAPGSEERDVSFYAILSVLLRHRRMLIVLPLLFATVVGTRAYLQDRTYSASASFMPQMAESRSGGAASLARQFGINVAGDRPGQSPEFYAALLRERAILRQAVETEYRVPLEGGGVRRANLIELFQVTDDDVVPAWRRAADRLRSGVSVSVARETGVVRFTVTAMHPVLAEQIAERLFQLLNEFNLETRQSQARSEGEFVEQRLTEARAELREAEQALERFYRQNRQFAGSPELALEHDRLQREVSIRNEVVASLAQSFEQARIDAVRDTPVITLIASPVGSSEVQARGTVRRTVLGFLLGLAVAIALAFAFDHLRRTRRQDRDDVREFRRLKGEAWDDVRYPARLIRRRPADREDLGVPSG